MAPLVRITADPLALAPLVTAVAEACANTGAVATFTGFTRGENGGRAVQHLDYEAYEPLALRVLAQITAEIAEEWPATVTGIHHRTGRVTVGEASVIIAAASPHRAAAFAAARYAIERIKQIAPIWKREQLEDGAAWVEGAACDPADAAARRQARRLACT